MIRSFWSRSATHPVDALILERWSPRAFSPDPLPEGTVETLFEAARWSPSCFNEQPWRFFYAESSAARERLGAALAESNRRWALEAPVLAFVFAKRTFTHNGKPNRWAAFDSGAAWSALTFQARLLGLHTHAMAGFDENKAYELCGISGDDFEAMAAIAIGRRADPSTLPDDLRSREVPSERKPYETVATKLDSKENE